MTRAGSRHWTRRDPSPPRPDGVPPRQGDGGGRRHVIEAFLAQHGERLAEPVEQIGRRRVGIEALGVALDDRRPIPIGLGHAWMSRTARSAFSPMALKPIPGGSISPFCEPRHRDVDAPVVMAELDRAERGDRVDHVERRVSGVVDRAGASQRNPARPHRSRSRCGPRITALKACPHGPRLSRVAPPLGGIDRRRRQSPRDRAPPRAPASSATPLPEGREVPRCRTHQHPVTGRQGVDQRRLPRAGAGGRIDDHR